jgi:hypothetical protein
MTTERTTLLELQGKNSSHNIFPIYPIRFPRVSRLVTPKIPDSIRKVPSKHQPVKADRPIFSPKAKSRSSRTNRIDTQIRIAAIIYIPRTTHSISCICAEETSRGTLSALGQCWAIRIDGTLSRGGFRSRSNDRG